ncbi:MAG: hypothetical protein HKM23_09505, partial [Nitrosopumilus sp.]|nr:hypothetical protein [Nitrosopumilus sp.]
MIKKSLVIFIAAIMVVGVIGTSFVPDADALKSKNSASSNVDICGLMLCSEYPGGKTAYQAEWVSMFRSSESVTQQVVEETMDKHHAPVSAHNVDEEFPEKLDVFIHKFELDKITADEAIDGIKETYHQYTDAKISNDIIKNVGEKLNLYKKGILNAEDAVEAIHLSAEPQNVNLEYQSALDEVIHKFELDKITADEAIDGIKEVHAGFVGLYIT